jgi:predicted RNase H-like HicB family nuclease
MQTSIRFTTQLVDKDNVIVAHCPELDVYSQGYTPAEARRNLAEAVHLFLDEARRIGTLEQILEEAGYSLVPEHRIIAPQPKARVFAESLRFDLAGV